MTKEFRRENLEGAGQIYEAFAAEARLTEIEQQRNFEPVGVQVVQNLSVVQGRDFAERLQLN